MALTPTCPNKLFRITPSLYNVSGSRGGPTVWGFTYGIYARTNYSQSHTESSDNSKAHNKVTRNTCVNTVKLKKQILTNFLN